VHYPNKWTGLGEYGGPAWWSVRSLLPLARLSATIHAVLDSKDLRIRGEVRVRVRIVLPLPFLLHLLFLLLLFCCAYFSNVSTDDKASQERCIPSS
jgi:hypothetical protein